MKYIRSILLIISFLIFGIGSLILNIIIFPPAQKLLTEDDYKQFSSKIIHFTWSIFIGYLQAIMLIKVCMKNKEKLENIGEGKIIVSTHPSFIDIVILMSLIPKTTCFVKSKLAHNKVFKKIVNSIFITNDTDFDDIKKTTKEYLDKGFNIIIFPMGIRHRKNEQPKIKKGASMIALHAQKDIIPIKITESEDFLFINQPFWQGGKKRVVFNIEVMDEIKTNSYKYESDIISKRELTKAIGNSLYTTEKY